MMRQIVYVWLVAMAAACNRGTPAATTTPANNVAQDDCATSSAALAKVLTPPGEEAAHPNLASTIATRCTEDQWTDAARTCFTSVTSDSAVHACAYKHLTQEQADKLADVQPSGLGAREAMAKMNDFKDAMCACADAACAQRVADDMTRWSQQMARDQRPPPKMSKGDVKQAAAIGEEMGQCMQKAMSQGAP